MRKPFLRMTISGKAATHEARKSFAFQACCARRTETPTIGTTATPRRRECGSAESRVLVDAVASTHAVRDTELAPQRFNELWRD